MVILITGKAGAGKTHYARLLQTELEADDYKVKCIDGDSFRKEKGNNNYDDEGRVRNLLDASELASLFEKKGFVVLMSFIMPRKSWRNKMRGLLEVSRIVYIPGGTLWKGTTYERPTEKEMEVRFNYDFKR